MPTRLPVETVIPDVLVALREHCGAVLVAPPGAGKTTAVAPALLAEPWCDGQILLLSPRRVAARAAAERMAEMLGEKAGETVGYSTRMDSRIGKNTRIVVMTEAIFVNRIVADPELPGVSAVLFDEAHERHLDSDLGLALAIESRSVLREDLRLLVMSATIDGARFARLLGEGTPAIESEGKAWPLRIEWLGAKAERRIDEQVASAVLTAWHGETGDVLAFLPGVGEIERVRERLEQRLPGTPILPLHGQVEPAAQRLAIRRDPEGRRRIVLATSIAETSLTLDGVSVVVDSGVARSAEFDIAAGTSHLVTRRASRAAAAQRAGRAARQGPGVAYRLWEEAGHAGRPEFDPPEIVTADLAPLTLALARWGEADPTRLPWLDPPPASALSGAREWLLAMGALDDEGRISAFGEKLSALPMDPVHAAMVLFGAEAGQGREAARVALLLQERGLGGRGEDLLHRLSQFAVDRGGRANAARRLADGWATRAAKLIDQPVASGANPATFLALAMPGNVARRRDASGENWISVSGRGFVLDPASSLARAEWLAIGDAQGLAKGARITAAAALDASDVEAIFADRIERRSVVSWNAADGRAEARLQRKLGAITLASGPDPKPDADAVASLLLGKARERLDTIVPASLLARAAHAGIAELHRDALAAAAEDWLLPLLHGWRDLDLPRGAVIDAVLARIDWDARQRLDRLAPREFTSPAGTRHAIDYAGENAPVVEVRVQALFGLDSHPMIGTTPMLLNLTSPAGRPIQATRDLPGFWRGSWADVAKDMKGRYPRHRWPERPWEEKPSLKTKNALAKGG
ncbi:ATP-dependent helicase HrpB [Croceicoccus ponticola]|uniref:RNA helicase n=1 Tax=Croceicoccus ponticola TaxID=2217664 RepID=A0A437GVL1_9SPHN|nr:ATP-dependent helicase HrpB [Croceicoccus ponticola]RVQ65830.1 ATP-dependent helicase HrpB [Croceicoccus ponticola]